VQKALKGEQWGSMKNTDTTPKFLTPKQLAARWQCSEMKLRRMRRAGLISVHYIGCSARYPVADIERVERESKA
jgi:hypothetical protein